MQRTTNPVRDHQNIGKPTPAGLGETKEITIKTLARLKAKLYANAARAMQQNPTKAEIIQKRADSDAAHLSFAINMVQIKC